MYRLVFALVAVIQLLPKAYADENKVDALGHAVTGNNGESSEKNSYEAWLQRHYRQIRHLDANEDGKVSLQEHSAGQRQQALTLDSRVVRALGKEYVPKRPRRESLVRFYEENLANYVTPAKISFEHRLIQDEKVDQLQRLLKQSPSERELLQRINPWLRKTMVSTSFVKTDLSQIQPMFGDRFTKALAAMPLRTWSPVLKSRLGFHIVKVSAYEKARQQTYTEAEAAVKQDWHTQQKLSWVRNKMSEIPSN